MKKTPIKLEDVPLDPEKYYMFFPGHFGDTFGEVGFVRWFEETVGGKVVCLVKPEQELIMRLFEREDYEIVLFDFKKFPLFSKRMKELSNMCVTPCKGKLFVAFHPVEIHPEVRFMKFPIRNRWECIATLFRAPNPPPVSAFQQPTDKHVRVSDAFKTKITSLAPLEKIVLLCPQSLSWNYPGWYSHSLGFWESEASTWTERGFTVIISSVDPFEFENAVYIPMTMEESLWLGIHCHYVIARRSGYVDILCWFRETATIVYPSHQTYVGSSTLSVCNKRFHEVILPEAAEEAEENTKLENKRKADAEVSAREQILINKINELFFSQSDKLFQKWEEELENTRTTALREFISITKAEESTALENRRKVDAEAFEKVQMLTNKVGESIFNQSDKLLHKWRREIANARGSALREFISTIRAEESAIMETRRRLILLPFTWLNLQRCRLGSHLLFGKLGHHYTKKKRMLRRRINALARSSRSPVVEQSSIDTLIAKNMIGDFSRQRALVIGGSRGIGLQCLRLLALGNVGGGGVLFTYEQSQHESVRVMNDLQQHGLKAAMLHLDVTHPSEQSLAALKKFAPTHLYYFATPKISSADKTLNEDGFRTFSDYYIFALHRLIGYLKPAGLRNVFMPSTIAITDFPKEVTAYAMSKAAMECWERVLNEEELHVYVTRLPRINTVQTQAMIPMETAAAEDILFLEMLKFEENSLYD